MFSAELDVKETYMTVQRRKAESMGYQKADTSHVQKAHGQTGYVYSYHYTTSAAEQHVAEKNSLNEG